jgi:hypothetical protein
VIVEGPIEVRPDRDSPDGGPCEPT